MFDYSENTPTRVQEILEYYARSRERIRLFYGDSETGHDWMEEYDIMGYIGRSTGPKPAALLINNARSLGGLAILTACIVKITVDKRTIYHHQNYHIPDLSIGDPPYTIRNRHLWAEGYVVGVYSGPCQCGKHGGNIANFKSTAQAKRYIAFLKGERNTR